MWDRAATLGVLGVLVGVSYVLSRNPHCTGTVKVILRSPIFVLLPIAILRESFYFWDLHKSIYFLEIVNRLAMTSFAYMHMREIVASSRNQSNFPLPMDVSSLFCTYCGIEGGGFVSGLVGSKTKFSQSSHVFGILIPVVLATILQVFVVVRSNKPGAFYPGISLIILGLCGICISPYLLFSENNLFEESLAILGISGFTLYYYIPQGDTMYLFHSPLTNFGEDDGEQLENEPPEIENGAPLIHTGNSD
mmetsp:Transcript_13560/g.20388  ORF Transcript_13560/g.20388 Transcript_13560/m.20388 type:complete len:249 (+) Transcript_13560:39-785(+)